MVPEPFTFTVAAFGIVSTLLNAALSAVENVHERYDKYKDCASYLRGAEQDMHIYKVKFEKCISNTSQGDQIVSQQDFDQYVSVTKHERLLRQIELTRRAMVKLSGVLVKGFGEKTTKVGIPKGDDSVTHHMSEETASVYWTARYALANLRKDAPVTKHFDQKPPRWSVRLSYTFLRGQDIEARVKGLKVEIDRLENIIEQALDDLPRLHAHAPDRSSLSLLERLRLTKLMDQEWSNFTSLMRVLSASQLRMLLRAPDPQGHVECIRGPEDITVSFLYEEYGQYGPTHRRVVHVSQSEWAANQIANEELIRLAIQGSLQKKSCRSSVKLETPRTTSKDLLTLYKQVGKLDPLKQRAYQKKWEREVLDTAVGLLAWSLLLWDTPWINHMFTCQLWRFPNHSKASIIALGHHHNSQNLICESHIWHDNHSPQISPHAAKHGTQDPVDSPESRTLWLKSRMLVLGVTLSEMALASPLKAELKSDSALAFYFQSRIIDRATLLDLVLRAQGIQYRMAVDKCFAYGLDTSSHSVTVREVLRLSEDIVVPLDKWKKSIYEQDEQSKARKLLATLVCSVELDGVDS